MNELTVLDKGFIDKITHVNLVRPCSERHNGK